MSLVPDAFVVPLGFEGPGFRLEPLGPQHNERDHEAWMSSIDHVRETPDFPDGTWPRPMTLEANLADLVRHAKDFEDRSGFTYSMLDGDEPASHVTVPRIRFRPLAESDLPTLVGWLAEPDIANSSPA